MQGSGGQPRRRRPRSPIDTLMPTDRLDAIVTYAPFRSSVRVKSCTSKNPKSWAGSGNCVSGRTMIATCSNPACNAPFLYFRSGKIFMFEASDVDPKSTTDPPKRRIEFFWLCGECAPGMDLMRTTNGEVTICQSPRPSGSPVALRIAFAREVTGSGIEHRRFRESQVS